jgi:type VI secretion system (T6SS) phospholipase Tle1-like effector/processive rubber oxygenase RoxA-like protein
MPRNIVVCCDGTGNEYGSENSNVVKLYWTLSAANQQTAYYHPGVGTMGARNALTTVGKWWTKIRGLAFGYGFSDNIADVYSFLMREFRPGDQIYIFGFSRGSYTARALCGLLHMCGLLTPGNEALIPYAIRLYKSNDPQKFKIASGFKTTFSVPCVPHFLGLFDTVSSIGWILDPIHTKGGHLPYTATLPDIPVIRHAVSIDERRAFFRQNLVHQPLPPNQNLKEVWFAGVHSDVGGSYPESESGLSKISLRWMICEAEAAGLLLDPQKVIAVLGGALPYVPPDPKAQLHKSLHGIWWVAEFWPKGVSAPINIPGQSAPVWKRRFRINLGSRRFIPDGVHIHQSVIARKSDPSTNYNPKNFPNTFVPEPSAPCELVQRPVHNQPVPGPVKPPLRRRPAIVTALMLLGLIALAALTVVIFTIRETLEVPKIDRPAEVKWLWQNWTDEQRHQYYHMPQGSILIPYAWFLALEQPQISLSGAPLFRDDSYMEGFGFIPDTKYAQNPDALPVGFTRDDRYTDPFTGQRNVVLGLTCAACHTGELFYGGKAIRIDAGPAMVDQQKFTLALGLAVTWTYYDPLRFRRFAHRVLGPDPSPADQKLLRTALKYYLDTAFAELKANRKLFPTPEGYGRTDALARIGNFVFGTELDNRKNLIKGDAPVNFPPVWDAPWFDWVQYNGSIPGPLGRNVGEALGVRSRINLLGYPGAQYQNTVRVENLHQIELLLGSKTVDGGVWSPEWPQDVLGKIDPVKAENGRKLYDKHCLHCHQPPMLSVEAKDLKYWTPPKPYSEGRRFFKVVMCPLEEIGTDPNQAQNFAKRMADSGPLGLGVVPATTGLLFITQKVIDQAFAEFKLTPDQQKEWNGFRENGLTAPLKYKARPHNGIWATPPYLHNGSVPNVYSLLSPVSERPTVFYVGSKQYDPVKMGLNTDFLKGATKFCTNQAGNSNAGHEFNDGSGKGIIGPKLTVDQRMEIIEYLKQLSGAPGTKSDSVKVNP